MNINIRKEEKKEYAEVENLIREAFWNLYFPGCDEHYTAHCIRKHDDFIPELSFVIELDNKIVGAIFYTHSKIVDSNGKEFPTITFGPVAILPEYQRKGFGAKLIKHSIAEATKLGHKAIMICGFPEHYTPYNFIGSKKYNITMPDSQFYTGVMALPLEDGALDGVSGSLYFSSVFEGSGDVDKLEEFDKQFAKKEKLSLPRHGVFELAAVEIDNNLYE